MRGRSRKLVDGLPAPPCTVRCFVSLPHSRPHACKNNPQYVGERRAERVAKQQCVRPAVQAGRLAPGEQQGRNTLGQMNASMITCRKLGGKELRGERRCKGDR